MDAAKLQSQTLHTLRPPTLCNAALDRPLTRAEKAAMIAAAEQKLIELFDVLKVDHRRDHNTRDTPRRVAKMYVEELMSGRFSEPPAITSFENSHQYQGLIVTGPIELRSTCAHHLMPIYGTAIIGLLPAADGRLIGLSKFDRIVRHFAGRLQIQEDLVKQICDFIVAVTSPRGLAVRISAVHMCKTHRGVRATHRSQMVTTAYFGALETDVVAKSEFLQECAILDKGAVS